MIIIFQCDETPHRAQRAHHAHRTTSRRERRVTGRFAPSSIRPIGRIQRFLLIQLKPKPVFRTVRCTQCARCAVQYHTFRLNCKTRIMNTPCNMHITVMNNSLTGWLVRSFHPSICLQIHVQKKTISFTNSI